MPSASGPGDGDPHVFKVDIMEAPAGDKGDWEDWRVYLGESAAREVGPAPGRATADIWADWAIRAIQRDLSGLDEPNASEAHRLFDWWVAKPLPKEFEGFILNNVIKAIDVSGDPRLVPLLDEIIAAQPDTKYARKAKEVKAEYEEYLAQDREPSSGVYKAKVVDSSGPDLNDWEIYIPGAYFETLGEEPEDHTERIPWALRAVQREDEQFAGKARDYLMDFAAQRSGASASRLVDWIKQTQDPRFVPVLNKVIAADPGSWWADEARLVKNQIARKYPIPEDLIGDPHP